MAPKQQYEKQAWQWAETTAPGDITLEHVETAFRVNFPACKKGVCRKNCAGNPNCLMGIGEREWQKEFEDSYWHDIADPSADARKEGAFVGLKNLGATCYVNTFLQVWFANPVFRNTMYRWKEIMPWEPLPEVESNGEMASVQTKEEAEKGNAAASQEVELLPPSVAGHLQLIFALLQFSVRRYVDPSPLMRFLGLDTGQQQDAQEFSKLFISLLEDTLRSHADPEVISLIQTQFQGSYSYITECQKCHSCSNSASQFYELDLNIKGTRSSIEECIEEFLKEEKLEGDNRYFCTNCESKQNAGRRIKLTSLPPVLNLQLLRFVFERQTGHKKKLNTYLQFPELLDMSKYLEQPEGAVVYELCSVLIHRGPSAYSGHYVAHILDTKSDTWYKFNDEDTEKIGSRNLNLGNEEEIEGKTPTKKPKTPKGSHNSKNAYMLVYRLKGTLDPGSIPDITMDDLPDLVRNHVEKDNQRYYDWVKEMTAMRDSNVQKGKSKQQEVHEVYKILSAKRDSYELISTKWLKQWLAAETIPAPPVDNNQLLCTHGKLCPEKVTKMKCISQQSAEILYTKYGGGPRYGKKDLCWKCVEMKCREIHLKAKVDEDSKVIGEVLKVKNLQMLPEECHWIGKKSLRSWRRLVMEQTQEATEENGANGSTMEGETPGSEDPGQSSGESGDVTQSSSQDVADKGDRKDEDGVERPTEKVKTLEKNQEEEESELKFNQDATCETHGGLSMDESVRRLIPTEVWQRLQEYFPECPEFPGTSSVCEKCLEEYEANQRKLEQNKTAAQAQKNSLSNLFHGRNRPVWGKNINQLMVVSNAFLDMWRGFLRDPLRMDQIEEINNRILLCDHGGFIYEPGVAGFDRESDSLSLVWPEEWQELRKHHKTDITITISRVEEEQMVTYISEPDVCQECLQNRQQAYHAAMLAYDKATIYVRKVLDDKTKAAGSRLKEADSPVTEDGKDSDPEFVQENGKRKKLDGGPAEKAAKVDLGVRRSSRHRKQRGEKEITVSSTQTLWDLKLQLMKLFSAAPMDQHLMLDGVELKGDKQPLYSFSVLPESILYLRVDEPCDDPTFLDDVTRAQNPEMGFKGDEVTGAVPVAYLEGGQYIMTKQERKGDRPL